MASASFWEGHAQVSVTGSPLVFQPAGRSLFVAIGRNKVSPLVYSAGTAIAGGLRWCDGSSVDARDVVCRAVRLADAALHRRQEREPLRRLLEGSLHGLLLQVQGGEWLADRGVVGRRAWPFCRRRRSGLASCAARSAYVPPTLKP